MAILAWTNWIFSICLKDVGNGQNYSHVIHGLVISLLGNKKLIFFGSEPVPVRQLKVNVINQENNDAEIQTSFPSSSVSLCVANGSLCSWSRYFSRLKKVSKKTGVILQYFKSFRLMLFAVAGLIMSSIYNISVLIRYLFTSHHVCDCIATRILMACQTGDQMLLLKKR